MPLLHKHHVIPKYEGGSDNSSNLVDLPVIRHAMWHFAEWQRKGRKEDWLAWRGLAGISTKEEIVTEGSRLGGLKTSAAQKGIHDWTNPRVIAGRKRGQSIGGKTSGLQTPVEQLNQMRQKSVEIRSKPVLAIYKGNEQKRFSSITAAANFFQCSDTTIVNWIKKPDCRKGWFFQWSLNNA